MKRPFLALVCLAGVTLACGTYVTPTTTAEPQEVSPTALPSPSPLPPTQTATVPTATPADTAVVVQAIVNVRAEPDGAVIGSLAAGDVVEVIGCDGGWCKVETEQMSGFVWQGCLSLETELECQAK